MKFSFEVGNQEKHKVTFYWNALVGGARAEVDGKKMIETEMSLTPPFSWGDGSTPTTAEQWNVGSSGVIIQLIQDWSFEVGKVEKHSVRIEKERSKWVAGLRPQKYRVFVDNHLISEIEGI